MKVKNFTGIFLIAVLVAGAVAAAVVFIPALRHSAPQTLTGWLNGAEQKAIEKTFDESLPHAQASIDAWGRAGFVLFGEGVDGVLIGTDGWLFSTEEFARAADFQHHITDNLAYVIAARDTLLSRKASLLIVPVPSKARLYKDKLGTYRFPAYWQAQYDKFTAFLEAKDVAYIDLFALYGKVEEKDSLYLKTDTHWTPDGARRAAQAVAAQVSHAFPYLSWPASAFRIVPGETVAHEGDLMRYVRVGGDTAAYGLAPDRLRTFTLDAPSGGDLFVDQDIPVVLIGTSYSADARWGFESFLKESLQADILNRADEGQGPFEVMRNYLASDTFKKSPPQLVIWEIPERYLPVPFEPEVP